MDLQEFDDPQSRPRPLPAFEACGWNSEHVEAHCSPTSDQRGRRVRPPIGEAFAPLDRPPSGFAGQPLRLEHWAEDDEGPKGAQLEAFNLVIERQADFLDAVLDAVVAHYRKGDLDHYQSLLGAGFPTLAALLETREGVRSLLQFRAICLGEDEGPKGVAVGFYGNDPLDEEHGFGVLTKSGRVLRVGGSTTGWSF